MKWLQVRLLPVTLMAMVMVLGFRVSNIFDEDAGPLVTLPQAQAAADAEKETPPAEETAAADETKATEEKAAMPEPVQGSLAGRDPATFSPSEIALLENLAKRRDEIEQRGREMDVREQLLAATEGRIDTKIDELKELEKRIDALIAKHDEAEEERLSKLVVVYEKMKAKDAARIFDQIEMDILLDVARRMKETKVAEVMAKMNPRRAQELTIALATRNDLESQIRQ